MIDNKEFKKIIVKKLKDKNFNMDRIKIIVKKDSRYKNFYNAFIYLLSKYGMTLSKYGIEGLGKLGKYSLVLECYETDKKILNDYWDNEIETLKLEALKTPSPDRCRYIKHKFDKVI